MSKQAVSSSPGPQIRKAFLPLVAKGASDQKIERLTGKLSATFGISSETVNAYRAWLKIHADRALSDLYTANPKLKKLLNGDQLIKLACDILDRQGAKGGDGKIRSRKLASSADLPEGLFKKPWAGQIVNLVRDYQRRIFDGKRLDELPRQIAGPKHFSSRTTLSLEQVKDLDVRELILGQVARFMDSVDGRRLLRRARQPGTDLHKSRDFPTLILFSRLYADRFKDEAGDLGIKIAECLVAAKERTLEELGKQITNHDSEIGGKLDVLVEMGYLNQRHHLQHKTLYALNPILSLYYAACSPSRGRPAKSKTVNALVLEVADYCQEITAPVRR